MRAPIRIAPREKVNLMSDILEIAGFKVEPGCSQKIEMPIAQLYTSTQMSMPIQVIRSKKPGPIIFVSAAMHGDELNGVEIIRRIMKKPPHLTSGSLILVPMINVFGVLNLSRYMPDRRDLNRSFPGSAKGSLASRMAHLFLNEVVNKCDYGIDLHTGAIHRSNFPQIRANLKDPTTLELAKSFGVPVLLNSDLRDGSLRQTASEAGTKILLYEAGEALRFDELSIRAGVKGIKNVLNQLGMIRKRKAAPSSEPFIAYKSSWIRASESGIVRDLKHLGDRVKVGDLLAEIGDPFGMVVDQVTAIRSGIIIGKQNIPLIHEGEAMFNIASFDDLDETLEVKESIEQMQDELLDDNT